jgi:hypothetical protein
MRNRPATLVVIEFGASWPRWMNPAHTGDLAVVAQHYEGSPNDLIGQVANRLMKLTHAGWHLDEVVLVVNGRSDQDASAARSVLARGLMAHLRNAGACHLTLSVSEALGRRSMHAVTSLAASLEPMARATDVVLAVRLGEEPPVYSRPLPPLPLPRAG